MTMIKTSAYGKGWIFCGVLAAIFLLLTMGCGQPSERAVEPSEPAEEPEEMGISDFVRETYVEGMPYDVAGAYGSEAVPTLLEMLNDPAEEPYHANIAVALCIIGDERAVDPVIALIEKAVEGEPTPQDYRIKESAVMALGYLVNKAGNDKALGYLIRSADPDAWRTRGFQPSTAERTVDLSTQAILGLALSGHPQAAQALNTVPTDKFSAVQPAISEFVLAAQEAHQEVAQDGLSEYYRKAKSGYGN